MAKSTKKYEDVVCHIGYTNHDKFSEFWMNIPSELTENGVYWTKYKLYNNKKYINIMLGDYNITPDISKMVTIERARQFWNILRNSGWSIENVCTVITL